jgi:hypothetical protein
MPPRKTCGSVAFLRPAPDSSDLVNLEKAKDSVVTTSAVLLCKETEEKKYVTDANPLLCQVPLSSASLTEGAPAAVEHRVFVAEICRAQPPPRRPYHNITQPRHFVSRFRPPHGRDWQADRLAVHDRRWGSAGRTVEPFAAEDDPHLLSPV